MPSIQFKVSNATSSNRFKDAYVQSQLLPITYTDGELNCTFAVTSDIVTGDYLYSTNGATQLGGGEVTVSGTTITVASALPNGTASVLVAKKAVVEDPIVYYEGTDLTDVATVFNTIQTQNEGVSLIRRLKTVTGTSIDASPSKAEFANLAEFEKHFRFERTDNTSGKIFHAIKLVKHSAQELASGFYEFDLENKNHTFNSINAMRLAKKFQDQCVTNVATLGPIDSSAFLTDAGALDTFRIYEIVDVAGRLKLKDLTNPNNQIMDLTGTGDLAADKTFIKNYFNKVLGASEYTNVNDVAAGHYVQHSSDLTQLNATMAANATNLATLNSGTNAKITIESSRFKLTVTTNNFQSGEATTLTLAHESNFFSSTPSSVSMGTITDTLEFSRNNVAANDLEYGYFVLDSNKQTQKEFTTELNFVVKPNGVAGSGSTGLSILSGDYQTQTNGVVNSNFESDLGTRNAGGNPENPLFETSGFNNATKVNGVDYGTIKVEYIDAAASGTAANAGKLKVTVTVNQNLDKLDETTEMKFTIEAKKGSIHRYITCTVKHFNQAWSMSSTQDVATRNSWRVLTDKDNNNTSRKALASFGISAPLWDEDSGRIWCAPRVLSDIMSLFCNWSYNATDVFGDGSKGYYTSLDFTNAATTMYDNYRLKKDELVASLRAMAGVAANINAFSVDVIVDFTLDNVTGGFTKKDGSHFLQYGDSQLQTLMGNVNATHPENIRAYTLRVNVAGDVVQLMIRTDQDAHQALNYTYNDINDHNTPFGTDAIQGIASATTRYRTHFMSVKNAALVGKDIRAANAVDRRAVSGAFEMVPSNHANAASLTLDTTNGAQAGDYRYIKIGSDLTVADLTLQPGTLVEFEGNFRLTVTGVLTAVGTKGNPIVFRGTNDTAGEAFGATPAARWKGLTVGNSSNLTFSTIIGGGSNGASLDVGSATGLTMDHVTIMNSQNTLAFTSTPTVAYLRLMNNAGAAPTVTGTVYTFTDGRFDNGGAENQKYQTHQGDDAFDSNYYMTDHNRADVTLEWTNPAGSYAEASMGIFMFYRKPHDNSNRLEYMRIARADNDIGMYAYAVNLMDPTNVTVAAANTVTFKRSIAAPTTHTIGTYVNGTALNNTAFPQVGGNPSGLFLNLASNDGTGVLTSDGSNIHLQRNSSDEVPTSITVNVRNGNGQLYAVDSNDGVSNSIALSYKEDVEAEIVRQEPISNPFKIVIPAGTYTDANAPVPSGDFANYTQVVIDGTVILANGANWTFGANTDIVMMEKTADTSKTLQTYAYAADASALVVTGTAQLTFGVKNIIRGHLDRMGNGTTNVAGLFCGTGSTTYTFNRHPYPNLGSTPNPNVTLNGVQCLVPQLGASDGAALDKHITDGIRVPSVVTAMTVTDVALIEKNAIISTLRMEPGATLKFHQWVLDDATSATVLVNTALDCVGDATNCVTIDGVILSVTGTADLRYATSNKPINVNNATSNLRQLKITAPANDANFTSAANMGLILGATINSDVRDIVMDGCGIECSSSDCILQQIDILNMPSGVSPLNIINCTPTIRNIHYTSAGNAAAPLVAETGTITTTLAAGNYLTDVEDGTGIQANMNAKENDMVAYKGATAFNAKFYLYCDKQAMTDHTKHFDQLTAAEKSAVIGNGTDAKALKKYNDDFPSGTIADATAAAAAVALGTDGWFIHVGSRLDKDIQQFGSVSGAQSTEAAFGYALIGGKRYACETSLTETMDKNADRGLVLTTSKLQATFTLTNAGNCTATSTKLKLQNMSPANATTSTNSVLVGAKNRAALSIPLSRSAKSILMGAGANAFSTTLTGTEAAPVIAQSELGKLDRGRYSLTSVASDNAYVAIYGANTSSNKLGNIGSNIALIDVVGDAITPENGVSTLTKYYIENCSGDAIAAGTGAGDLTCTELEIVNPEGHFSKSDRVQSTDGKAYLESIRRLAKDGTAQALLGTFTTPQVPHQFFFKPTGAAAVSSRLNQWWHTKTKVVAAIDSHTSVPSGKVAEIRIFGGNDESPTITMDGTAANNCGNTSLDLTYTAGVDAPIKAKFTVGATIAGTITVGSQDLYAGSSVAPAATAAADKTKEKHLTDQTALGDVVAFAATGLSVNNAFTKYINVQGTAGGTGLKEALLPPLGSNHNSADANNQFAFVDDAQLRATLATPSRTGVIIQEYVLNRKDYALSNAKMVHENNGFYATKKRSVSAFSNNDLTIKVVKIPVVDILDNVGGNDLNNSHQIFKGSPDTGGNGWVAKTVVTFSGTNGAITAKQQAIRVSQKLTLDAAGTFAIDEVVVQGTTIKGKVAEPVTNGTVVDIIHDHDSTGPFAAGAATINGNAVTVSSEVSDPEAFQLQGASKIQPKTPGQAVASADESSEVMVISITNNANYDSETSSESHTSAKAYMDAQTVNSTAGPKTILLSRVADGSLFIGSSNALASKFDNSNTHTICQTAIGELLPAFNRIDFFTSTVRRHRELGAAVSCTFTADQQLAKFIGTYSKTDHADIGSTTEDDTNNVAHIEADLSGCIPYAGKGHFKTVITANGSNQALIDGTLQSAAVILSGIVTIEGDVIFQDNVTVYPQAQLFFKDGAKVRIAATKTFAMNGGTDTTKPIIVRHINDHTLNGVKPEGFDGLDLSGAGTCTITNALLIGGKNQLIVPASATVTDTRFYNAGICALTLNDTASVTRVHIRNARNAIKVDAGTATLTDVLVENTLNKVIDHASTATPVLTRCHFDCLSDSLSDAMFTFGSSAVTATNCQLVQTADKHLPRGADVVVVGAAATLGGKCSVSVGAFANPQSLSIFDNTKTTLEYLQDTMANGIDRQVAHDYLPPTNKTHSMTVTYDEQYSSFYNNANQQTSSAITQNSVTMNFFTKNYGANLAFSSASSVTAKSDIRLNATMPTVATHADYTLDATLARQHLYAKRMKADTTGTMETLGSDFISASLTPASGAIALTNVKNTNDDYTQFMRLTATATPVIGDAHTETASTAYHTAGTIAYYGQRPEFRFYKKGAGTLTSYSTGAIHSWLLSNQQLLTYANLPTVKLGDNVVETKSLPIVITGQTKSNPSTSQENRITFSGIGFASYTTGNPASGSALSAGLAAAINGKAALTAAGFSASSDGTLLTITRNGGAFTFTINDMMANSYGSGAFGGGMGWKLNGTGQALTFSNGIHSLATGDPPTSSTTADVIDEITASKQLVVEPHGTTKLSASGNITAVQDYNLILTGATPVTTVPETDFKSNVSTGASTVKVEDSPTYSFHNTVMMPLFDQHAYGISKKRASSTMPAVLTTGAAASYNFAQNTTATDGQFTISRKTTVSDTAQGAVQDFNKFSTWTMPTDVVTAGIFADRDLVKATGAYISDVQEVESAFMPSIQPLKADTAGMQRSFDRTLSSLVVANNAGTNSAQQITTLRIQPHVGATQLGTDHSVTVDDYTVSNPSGQGVQITQSSGEFYTLQCNSFSKTTFERINMQKVVTFPSNSGNTTYTFVTSNLPQLKLGEAQRTTALSTTIDQQTTKFGIVDELENAFKNQTALIHEYGGIAVLQNIGQTGFDGAHAVAPTLYQIDDETELIPTTNINTKRSGVLEFVAPVSGLDATGVPITNQFTVRLVDDAYVQVTDASGISVGDIIEQEVGGLVISDVVRFKDANKIYLTNCTKFDPAKAITVYRGKTLIQTIAANNVGAAVQTTSTSTTVTVLGANTYLVLYNELNLSHNGYVKVISQDSTSKAYTLEVQGDSAPTDFNAANLRFHYVSGPSGTTINAIGTAETVDFVSPHASNVFKTQLANGTTTVCNNLVVAGLKTVKSNTQHNYKYLVHMQLDKNGSTKHSVAFLRSLVPNRDDPTPFIVDAGGANPVFTDGMIAVARGQCNSDKRFINALNQTIDLVFVADSTLSPQDAVRYGVTTADITVPGGLSAGILKDQAVTQGGRAIGTVVASQSAGSTSFQINMTDYTIQTAGNIVVNAAGVSPVTVAEADYTATQAFQSASGSSGTVSGVSADGKSVTISGVQGQFIKDATKTFTKLDTATNHYRKVNVDFSTQNSTLLHANGDIVSTNVQSIQVKQTGTKPYQLGGSFDVSTRNWLSGIVVRKPSGTDGRNTLAKQFFLADDVVAKLHKKESVARTNAATVSVTRAKTITLTGPFEAGDTIDIQEAGASLNNVLTLAAGDSAANAATKLAAHLTAAGAAYNATAAANVVTLNKTSAFGAVTAVLHSNLDHVTIGSQANVVQVNDNGETQTITIEGNDANYQGSNVTIVMDIAGTAVTTTVDSTGAAHPTKSDIAAAMATAIIDATAFAAAGDKTAVAADNVVTLTHAAGQGAIGTVALHADGMTNNSGKVSQLQLAQAQTDLGSAGNANSSYSNGYDIMDIPTSINRTQKMDSAENFYVDDVIEITSVLGGNTTTHSIQLTHDDKNQYATSNSLWALSTIAAKLRKMGQYAHVDAANQKLVITYAAANDNVTLKIFNEAINNGNPTTIAMTTATTADADRPSQIITVDASSNSTNIKVQYKNGDSTDLGTANSIAKRFNDITHLTAHAALTNASHTSALFEVLVAKDSNKVEQLVQKVGSTSVGFNTQITQKELTFTGEGTVGHKIQLSVTTDHNTNSIMTEHTVAAGTAGAGNLNALVTALHGTITGLSKAHVTVATNKITFTAASGVLLVTMSESGLETVPTVATPDGGANTPFAAGTHTITFTGAPQTGDVFNFGFNGATTEVTAADSTMASLLAQFKGIVNGVANFTAAVSGDKLIVTAAAGQALPANNSTIAQTSETAETAAVQVNTTSTVTVGNAASLVKGNTITINDGTTDYKLIYMAPDQDETVDSELTRLKDKVNAVNATVTVPGGLPANLPAGAAVTQDGTAVGTVVAAAAAAATSFQINTTALMQSGTGVAGDLAIAELSPIVITGQTKSNPSTSQENRITFSGIGFASYTTGNPASGSALSAGLAAAINGKAALTAAGFSASSDGTLLTITRNGGAFTFTINDMMANSYGAGAFGGGMGWKLNGTGQALTFSNGIHSLATGPAPPLTLTDDLYTVANGYTATYDSATKSIAIAADDTIGFTATTGDDADIN